MPEKKKTDRRKAATPRSQWSLLAKKLKRRLLRTEKAIYDAADRVLAMLQEAELPEKVIAFFRRTRPQAAATFKTSGKLILLFILFCLEALRRTPWHKIFRRMFSALRIKTMTLAKTSKWQLAALILFALLMLGGTAMWGVISYFSRGLPDIDQLAEYNPPVTTRLYAADGRLLEEYAKEKRIYVPITAMPRVLINAFLAAEDRNFYTHPGVDIFSILRAMVQNALNRFSDSDRGVIGASTITQQVAKNILLSRERTYERKIKEAILAMRMTQAYSKDRILELYLNEIYLGAGSYGVAAAALNYFNKSIDELNVEEAALLAAMPKAPSAFDPRNHYARARARRDWVIGRMYEEGFITEGQAKTAVVEPIRLRSRGNTEITSADFFAEEVRRALEKVYGREALYSGGLTVMTTLDPHLQKLAEKALQEGLIDYDTRKGFHGRLSHIPLKEHNWAEALSAMEPPPGLGDWQLAVVLGTGKDAYEIGLKESVTGSIDHSTMAWATHLVDGKEVPAAKVLAAGDVVAVERVADSPRNYLLRQIPKVSGALVALDPHNGRVLAMVGGYAYDKTQFNRATQARRQPGSAFKPFVYTAALETGYTPATLINDEPIEFEMTGKPKTALAPTSENPELAEEIKVWAPQNYSGNFYGPTTLRTGLEKSRNVMTVRLGLAMGVDKVVNIAKRFDISQNAAPNLSTVLGSSETTLLALTNAYGILVNGGRRIFPAMIERIQDRNGQTIYRRDTRVCDGCFFKSRRDLPEEFTPPELVDDREEVTDSFTAYQMVSLMEGVVKRGTGTRALAIGKPIGGKTGTTNESRDAWFIGFSPDLVTGVYVGFDTPAPLGHQESGASVALPVFVDFMEGALKETPAIPFRIPSGMKLVKIDMKTGFLPSEETPADEVLLEAFKPGTEPTMAIRRSEMLSVAEKPDTPPGSEEWKKDPRARDLPETRGTGGIY